MPDGFMDLKVPAGQTTPIIPSSGKYAAQKYIPVVYPNCYRLAYGLTI